MASIVPDTNSIKTPTALFHASKDVMVSTVNHHLERVPETNISHDIKRKLADELLEIASGRLVLCTYGRVALFVVNQQLAEDSRMLKHDTVYQIQRAVG